MWHFGGVINLLKYLTLFYHNTMHLRLLLILISLLLGSCAASHMPHSELVMFQERETADGELVDSRYVHGLVSGSQDLVGAGKILESNPGFESAYIGPFIFTHLVFMNPIGTSFSAAIGTGLGFDATFPFLQKYFGKTYLTQSFSPSFTFDKYIPNLQTIFQKRLYDGNPFGLSIGAQYQNRAIYFSGKAEGIDDCPGTGTYMWGCSGSVNRHSVGLRMVATLSDRSKAHLNQQMMMYGAFSLNYDLTHSFIFPSVSLSFTLR